MAEYLNPFYGESTALAKATKRESEERHSVLDPVAVGHAVKDCEGDEWVKWHNGDLTRLEWVKLTGPDIFLCVDANHIPLPIVQMGKLEDLEGYAHLLEAFEYN